MNAPLDNTTTRTPFGEWYVIGSHFMALFSFLLIAGQEMYYIVVVDMCGTFLLTQKNSSAFLERMKLTGD